jgi:hypothetical protein
MDSQKTDEGTVGAPACFLCDSNVSRQEKRHLNVPQIEKCNQTALNIRTEREPIV